MISELEIEKALDFLRDNAIKAAQSRAERAYVEEYRKVMKAQIMREFPGDSVGTQEARAYSDPRYAQHLVAIKDAVYEDERLRFLMSAAQAKIDAWQTQSANNRKGLA